VCDLQSRLTHILSHASRVCTTTLTGTYTHTPTHPPHHPPTPPPPPPPPPHTHTHTHTISLFALLVQDKVPSAVHAKSAAPTTSPANRRVRDSESSGKINRGQRSKDDYDEVKRLTGDGSMSIVKATETVAARSGRKPNSVIQSYYRQRSKRMSAPDDDTKDDGNEPEVSNHNNLASCAHVAHVLPN
jgi:hypothetical protein